MKANYISELSTKLYREIEERGVERIKELFSKGKTLSEELRYDRDKEYLKKMIMTQLDIYRMLSSSNGEVKENYNSIIRKINNDMILQFDTRTLDALFSNTLEIVSEEEYEKWKEFAYSDRHCGKSFDDILLEETFNYSYENESNPIKKFIKSFRYKKMKKEGVLEDSYIKRVREMIKRGIEVNPDNTLFEETKCHRIVERGVEDYESLKDIENIVRMTLISLTGKQGECINIEAECTRLRNEMRNTIGTTKIGKEYRQVQVTLGSESGISNREVIRTIPFEEIPSAMKNLQKEYEKSYNTEQSEEEYIRQIAKIYADFIYIQPYEDVNKRTAMCLFNSMLLSKEIIPPPISLTNDEEMIKALNKVYDEKSYTVIQDVMVEKCKKAQSNCENNINKDKESVRKLNTDLLEDKNV